MLIQYRLFMVLYLAAALVSACAARPAVTTANPLPTAVQPAAAASSTNTTTPTDPPTATVTATARADLTPPVVTGVATGSIGQAGATVTFTTGEPALGAVEHGTTAALGAVARDRRGNLAAGTSTGGTPNKYPGRVGDSPLIGCGSYADNAIGAVSCSGWGEPLIRLGMAKAITDRMGLNHEEADRAVANALKDLRTKMNGYGGAIVIDSRGKVATAFNTPRMARGYITSAMKTPIVDV